MGWHMGSLSAKRINLWRRRRQKTRLVYKFERVSAKTSTFGGGCLGTNAKEP
ncbi:hypothetical protein YC2023_013662 [Brassica napus]